MSMSDCGKVLSCVYEKAPNCIELYFNFSTSFHFNLIFIRDIIIIHTVDFRLEINGSCMLRPTLSIINLSWMKVSLEGLPLHVQMLLYFSDNE